MKQFWSKSLAFLLCLALLAGMLPATALAADGDTVYVGGVALTYSESTPVYATTDEDGNVLTADATAENYNIKWDGSTLTLNGAKIKGATSSESLNTTVGIYAFNNSENVSLNIALKGVNEIFESSNGIWVFTNAGNATLTIEGEGSLNASGSSSGILVQSNGGDAALTIKNADVTAENSTYSGDSVTVRAGSSSSASLSVDGGSLTATGKSEYGAGIRYTFGSSSSGSGKPSLTVSNSAIVRGNGGIANNSSTSIQYGTGNGENGGIVFDGNEGTVYGDVTLQEDLTIGEGESLIIPEGSSLTVPEDKTITVESGGKLEGTPIGNGTVKIAPTITTENLTNGEVGTLYTAKLEADGDTPITWDLASDSFLPAGLSLSADGTISGKPTTADTYTFTVTATNASGSDSKEYTIQIAAKSDTTPPMLTAGTVNRTSDTDATVTFTSDEAGTYFYEVVNSGEGAPADITSGTIYTLTSDTNIITLTNLTAGAKDIYIVAKDAAGNQSATLKIEIPTYVEPVYSISADTELDFGSVYTGYAQPAAQTVTITNNGNQPLTLTQPASTSSFEVGTLSTTELAAGEKATFTVQPKAGLAVGTYSEYIAVSGSEDATVTITASFTVKQYSSGGGSSSSTPSVSEQTIDKIEAAKDGSTVKITLRTGQTKLDKEVFEELAGRDVTLEISLSNGVTWTVNGQDIPENADLTDLDMGVSLNTSTIPVNLINSVTGEAGTVQLTLKHNGEFGFTMTLTAPVGVKNAGLWANLYHYDEDAGKMVYQTAALVDEDGNVALPFDHASQYALVLDSKSHDLPFTDLAANAWYTDAVAYVYRHDIMEGMSATTFQPNGTLTRAQAVQTFYNLEGQPDISDENLGYPYEDVDAQAWYGNAVYWARITGVATGYGDGTFQPGNRITRQEFAQMLYNYAKYKGSDLSAEGDLSQFPDSGSVADWAEAAMSWANGNELINGHDDGTIDAAGTAIRAQAASILMRFDQNLVEN